METTSNHQEEKRAMILRWQSSGMSQGKFCKSEGIAYHHFHYWLKKFRRSHDGGGFVQLRSGKGVSDVRGSRAEVCFANGNRVVFHGAVNIAQLKQLVG